MFGSGSILKNIPEHRKHQDKTTLKGNKKTLNFFNRTFA